MTSEKANSWDVILPHESDVAILARLFDLLVVGGGLWVMGRACGVDWNDRYTLVSVGSMALYLLAAEHQGLYRSWRLGGLRQEIAKVLAVWAVVGVCLLAVGHVVETPAGLWRCVMLNWCAVVPTLLVSSRVAVRGALRWLRTRGWNQRRVALAGAGELGLRVAQTIMSEPWMGLKLVGFYDDRRRVDRQVRGERATDIRGNLADLAALARRGEIDVVYLTLPMRAERTMKALARRLATTRVSLYFVPDLLAFAVLRSKWSTFGAISTVSLFETPLAGSERLVKRVEDVIIATLALAVAGIPMLVIAILVKLTSPGPAIFKQRRHGLDGYEIVVWKFRSMTVCEDGDDFQQVKRSDPRVTHLGAILRATSLDELPQLINVLQGRMSIVGPRPHPIAMNEEHRDAMDWYMLRHRVKPGITGWAQVNGFRGETDTPEKMKGRVRHDLEYIRRWSLWLDLRIIVLTLFRGFMDKNAY